MLVSNMTKVLFIIVTTIALIVALAFLPHQILAAGLELKYEAVNPGDDPAYVFKRLREKSILLIWSISSEKKADFYEKLLTVRLSELKKIVDKKDIANIQTTSQRYSATVGEYTDFLATSKLASRKEKVKAMLQMHIPVLEKLRDSYDYSLAEYRFIQYDIDYLKIYISKL